ncbi:LacI family DNA-binding transcriptional regulator [Niallia circulans]|uniref:LacI family DNA-binding transcriptional regulator n=1 Tax=Niallia circulans TaxID=1397 RepID=UPI0013DDB638|nr:LacI family DNA-binding transcriptional regulator [Niallia circulans]
MKVSIYDVANLAGVSISTVSRVLNKSGYISSKTEKKVMDAVEKLNFTPSSIARNLANNETKLIGLYFPLQPSSIEGASNTYLLEFINGVNSILIEQGYHLLLINEVENDEQILANQSLPQYYNFMKEKKLDGLIIGATPIICQSFLELLHSKLPVVYVGERTVKHIGLNVYAQYKKYNKDLLNHLTQNNHKHIAIISKEGKIIKKIAHEYMIKEQSKTIQIDTYHHEGSLETYLQLLKSIFSKERHPTALLLQDISIVQQTINYLNNIHFKVPNDISITTIEHRYGDGTQCFPAITSVYVPAFQMGVESATLLFNYLQGKIEFNQEVLIESIITERQSVVYHDANNIQKTGGIF